MRPRPSTRPTTPRALRCTWSNGSPYTIYESFGKAFFSPGPRVACLAGRTGPGEHQAAEIRVLDARSGDVVWRTDLTKSAPTLELPVAPDGTSDLVRPEERRLTPLVGPPGLRQLLTVAGEGRWIAYGAFMRGVASQGSQLFDGEPVVVLHDTLSNNRHEVRCSGTIGLRSMHLSTDGSRLTTEHGIGRLCPWNTQSGLQILQIEVGSMLDLQLAPDGKSLVAYEGGSQVGLWNCDTGQRVCQLSVGSVCEYAPDGRTLVIGTTTQLQVIEPRSGLLLLTIADKFEKPLEIAFSPDGTRFAVPHSDRMVHVFTASR